jgi:beta-galactosidase
MQNRTVILMRPINRKYFSLGFRRSTVALLCLLCCAAGSLSAQPVFLEQKRAMPGDMGMGLLTASEYKTIIDLNGEWNYRENGEEAWNKVHVPSSYTGKHRIHFRRNFSVPRDLLASSVFQIAALSVSYYCEISINGQFIGKHAGLTSFAFKITPGILQPGNNIIDIHVHNHLNVHETVPPYEQLWDRLAYGGIIHDIGIVAHKGVWVQESYVTGRIAGEGRPATLRCRTILNSGEISMLPGDTIATDAGFGRSHVSYQVEVVDPLTNSVVAVSDVSRVTVETDRLREVEFQVSVPAVRLWSPESPTVYQLRHRVSRGGTVLDETIHQIGFRSVAVSDQGLILNGNPLFLKSLTYMEDSPRHGRSMSLDEMERDILMMKNLGVNAIRLVNGPAHPYIYTLCDRYGILIFQDIPVRNVPDDFFDRDGFRTSAQNVFREMYARDFNHPALVAIGFAQGVERNSAALRRYIEEFDADMNRGDNFLSYLSYQSKLPETVPEGLDMVGIDVFPQSTDEIVRLLRHVAETGDPGRVFVGSLMYPVQIDNYNGYSDPRSIDAQGQFFLRLYREITELGFAGLVVHSFADWSVSRPIMAVDRVHQFTATAGIVDRYRQKRLAYDVLKAGFNNEKAPVLVTGAYEEEHPITFVVIGILIILIFAVTYNLFRRFRENVSRSLMRPYNFFADVRDKRMLSIFQTSMIGFIGALSSGLLFANIFYYWRMNLLADGVISQFVHDIPMKQWLNYAAWNPFHNILMMSLVFFLLLILFTVMLRIIAFMGRRQISLFDSLSVPMWSVLPMILLAPFGMVLYRLMELPGIDIMAILVYGVFNIWVVSRLLKGMAIVLDSRAGYFYVGGFVIIGAGISWWLMTLDGNYGVFGYLRYFADIWWTFFHTTA